MDRLNTFNERPTLFMNLFSYLSSNAKLVVFSRKSMSDKNIKKKSNCRFSNTKFLRFSPSNLVKANCFYETKRYKNPIFPLYYAARQLHNLNIAQKTKQKLAGRQTRCRHLELWCRFYAFPPVFLASTRRLWFPLLLDLLCRVPRSLQNSIHLLS